MRPSNHEALGKLRVLTINGLEIEGKWRDQRGYHVTSFSRSYKGHLHFRFRSDSTMLYNITVFSKGGIILWSKENQHLAGNPISSLVRDIFLQAKQTQSSYNTKDQQYTLQWEQDNVRQIFVVSVIPRGFPAPYVQPLLERVRSKFTSMFPECEEFGDYSEFDTVFEKIYSKTVKESTQRSSAPRSFAETEKGQRIAGSSKSKAKDTKESKEKEEKEDSSTDSGAEDTSSNASPQDILAKKGVRRGARKMRVGPGPSKKGKSYVSSEITLSDRDPSSDHSEQQTRPGTGKAQARKAGSSVGR